MKRKTLRGIVLFFLVIALLSSLVLGSRLVEFSQLQYGSELSLNGSTINIMTFNTSRIYITNGGLVGIGQISPNVTLGVSGDANITGTIYGNVGNFTGTVEAEYFVGDGSLLTGIDSSDSDDWNQGNFTSAYDARTGRYTKANYSAEYSSTGYDRENMTADYIAHNTSLVEYIGLVNVSMKVYVDSQVSGSITTSVWNSSNNNIYLNDSTASLGIGTSSPSYPIDIESASDYPLRLTSTDSNAGIIISDSDSTDWSVNVDGGNFIIRDYSASTDYLTINSDSKTYDFNGAYSSTLNGQKYLTEIVIPTWSSSSTNNINYIGWDQNELFNVCKWDGWNVSLDGVTMSTSDCQKIFNHNQGDWITKTENFSIEIDGGNNFIPIRANGWFTNLILFRSPSYQPLNFTVETKNQSGQWALVMDVDTETSRDDYAQSFAQTNPYQIYGLRYNFSNPDTYSTSEIYLDNIGLLHGTAPVLEFLRADGGTVYGSVAIEKASPNFELDVDGTINASDLNITKDVFIGRGINLGGEYRTSWGDSSDSDDWKQSNFTSAYDARTGRFTLTNYSAEYASTGYDRENMTADYIAHNTSLKEYIDSEVSGVAFQNGSDINVTNFVANNTLFVNGSRVGIGTSSPFAKLQILKDTLYQLTTSYGLAVSGVSNPDQTIGIGYDSSLGTNGAGVIEVFEKGLTPDRNLLLNPWGGNVGIGTTSPLNTLHVNGSGAQGGLRVTNSSDQNIFFVNSTSGMVGIGTANPSLALSISGELIVGQGTTSGRTRILIGEEDGVADKTLNIAYDHDNNYGEMHIGGDPVSTFVIADGGNIGIGTTTPNSDLTVEGNFSVQGNTNNTLGNFSIVQYNASCAGFRFGITGGMILSCE